MATAPPHWPAEDRLIADACTHSRTDRIRDLARELRRSESAVRQLAAHDSAVPAIDPWNAILDAAAAGCGLRLDADDVVRLATEDAIQRAALKQPSTVHRIGVGPHGNRANLGVEGRDRTSLALTLPTGEQHQLQP